MFRKNKKIFAFISSILGIVLLLIVPTTAFAGGPDINDSADAGREISPKVEVQTKDWLIISYSDKVNDKVATAEQLDVYLAETLYSMRGGSMILSGAGSHGRC